MSERLAVLHEDNHLLVVDKPAGLATMGVRPGEPSLVEQVRSHLREKYAKPGNVYVGVVSRLDAHASGAIVFARTSKAARRLTDLFADGGVEKTYWAVVEGRPSPPDGSCVDWLVKDEPNQRMKIASSRAGGAKQARLAYRTLHPLDGTGQTLVEVALATGRKHQIRVQLASRGWPILGDRKYGSRRPFPGIALHSRRLAFEHPVRKTPIEIVAPAPASWESFAVSV